MQCICQWPLPPQTHTLTHKYTYLLSVGSIRSKSSFPPQGFICETFGSSIEHESTHSLAALQASKSITTFKRDLMKRLHCISKRGRFVWKEAREHDMLFVLGKIGLEAQMFVFIRLQRPKRKKKKKNESHVFNKVQLNRLSLWRPALFVDSTNCSAITFQLITSNKLTH